MPFSSSQVEITLNFEAALPYGTTHSSKLSPGLRYSNGIVLLIIIIPYSLGIDTLMLYAIASPEFQTFKRNLVEEIAIILASIFAFSPSSLPLVVFLLHAFSKPIHIPLIFLPPQIIESAPSSYH